MVTTINVVYQIEKGDSWKAEDSIKIKSNIADEKLVDCQLSKSLVDMLVKESAILEPDKLLLKFAECQKREVELNLEALGEMELRASVQADKVTKAIQDSYDRSEKQYVEIQKRFNETTSKLKDDLEVGEKRLESQIEKIEKVKERLSDINNYDLERLNNVLNALIELIEKDKDLVKLVLDYKSNNQ